MTGRGFNPSICQTHNAKVSTMNIYDKDLISLTHHIWPGDTKTEL